MSTESLTSKQEQFCRLIALQGYSQYDAYRESYNVRDSTQPKSISEQASALISDNLNVSSRIEALKQSVSDAVVKRVVNKTALTKEYVLEQLHQNALKASQAIPVTDRSGNETGEFTYYPNAVNRSYELIGKELDMFKDKSVTEMQSQSISLELKAASLEELESMLALVREQQQQTALTEAVNTVPLVDPVELDTENAGGL
jgi:cell fate (sporulation/competence/biofilm development) regulator YmcA (YheA/YmcA/DUF963 family)